ncbi:hypothetical protein WH96_01150 [Kiloniella spongiae]|uniref:Uncharacterized protein n=1 Tax=Kiloniella spongiae TaxID=1489064 RepID=A0A0H2MJA3_9PROT|nr:hypothetical protein WH96_01150 [Kiloniella spongiae]
MRPTYNDTYRHEKVLKVYFYTSNPEKFLQATTVFGRMGQSVSHYSTHREPYDETYSENTKHLLREAIKQLKEEVELKSAFFIEDTSLRIDALSCEDDVPGMLVKEWFKDTSFSELDAILRERGNNRSATVKSDIALHIPTLSEPMFFYGETRGVVADTPPRFNVNAQYPWLTPDTFNGWVIPDEADKRLGEMEFEESLNYDFRAKSLLMLAERINEFNAAMNLKPTNYSLRKQPEATLAFDEEPSQSSQLELDVFKQLNHNIVVIGEKCAGKTTFGDYLHRFNSAGSNLIIQHIEASTVLREIASKAEYEIADGQDAFNFLESIGFAAVAEEIIEYHTSRESDNCITVVTGLRTTEELLEYLKVFPNTIVVHVTADMRTRYGRNVARARSSASSTPKDFQNNDELEASFGLLRVAEVVADITISNEGSMRDYHEKISNIFRKLDFLTSDRDVFHRELPRCIVGLESLGKIATCEEISDAIKRIEFSSSKEIKPVRKYNTNRALKSLPEHAVRHDSTEDKLLSYSLSKRGLKLCELFQLINWIDQKKLNETLESHQS